MRSRTNVILTMLAVLSLGGAFALSALAEEAVRVVVHPSNAVSTLSREEVVRIFLRQRVYWGSTRTIEVADLSATSPTRKTFSADVMRMPVQAVLRYWQEQIFSGKGVPPRSRATEAEVVAWVSENPSAIGYVSASTDIGSLKTVKVQ